MKIEFDPAKHDQNRVKHGIGLDRALIFDWNTALFLRDERKDYGEERITATGFLESRLHILCFTKRGDTIRIISLRKANQREIDHYERQKTTQTPDG